MDDTERSGAAVVLPPSKLFVAGDGCFMPFEYKSIDFIICSHVIEHIDNVNEFCAELNRVSNGGYLECPSKMAEILRHAPNHRWYVSQKKGKLVISPTPDGYPLGWFGKLFFSLYFYNTRQVKGRDVFNFAHGISGPFHYVFSAVREVLVRLWTLFKPLTYTRFYWQGRFDWEFVEGG
ncbi:MAG: methyltransferase domain-containing protein [Anaerolineales bacterium]|nr:methyltransferase domain-containing protein [Anaerolineales bacterium]